MRFRLATLCDTGCKTSPGQKVPRSQINLAFKNQDEIKGLPDRDAGGEISKFFGVRHDETLPVFPLNNGLIKVQSCLPLLWPNFSSA